MTDVHPGLMFVISGPSGAGKSTVLARVLGALGDLQFSVSATTRDPRPGEVDGTDYYYVTHDRFSEMIREDDLLEWAEVHGQFYGTPAEFVRAHLRGGCDVVLDLDVQGARKVRERFHGAIFIFLAPPSMEELSKRLHGRHTENEERIKRRLANAQYELAAIHEYDYLVVNDHVSGAALALQSIIEAERARVHRVIDRWPQLLEATRASAEHDTNSGGGG
ncbi:MAG: guanylate kinase [Proteobacteria bacterium]|nr:guanylate kinase [Pseudomonadota bacterium]